MLNVLAIVLAIIPGLLICWYIYSIDKYEKENWIPLTISFFLGVLVTLPAFKIEEFAHSKGFHESENLFLTFLVALIIVGLVEEAVKFLAFYAYPYRSNFFNEPIDGIVYAVMISMGFATLENIYYAWQYGWVTSIVRAFTAVPAHGVFAVIMGYYGGKSKMSTDKREKWQYLLIGLGIAVLVHGVYDFFILQELAEWLMLVATLILYSSIYFVLKMIKEHQQNSPFATSTATTTDVTTPPINEELLDTDLTDAIIKDMGTNEDSPK